MSTLVKRLPEKGMSSNSYLIERGASRILIDPSQPLPADWLKPTAIVCTHGHYDHLACLEDLRSPTCPVIIGRADASYLTDPNLNLGPLFGRKGQFQPADRLVTDGEIIDCGDQISLEWQETPGHTPGSACFLLRADGKIEAIFTGDTLFCDSIGRTDFPGGDSHQMLTSLVKLKRYLQELPPDLPLYPGHGPTTTPARELKHNMFLQQV